MLDALDRKNLGFFIIFSCILMQTLNWGSAYRFFAYLNVLIVLIFGFFCYRKNPSNSRHDTLYGLFFIPLAFIAIHFLSVENISIIK